jgi:hypothetical protein
LVTIRRYTPEERRKLIARTEDLLGWKLNRILERHLSSPRENPNRLLELLLRLRRAEANPDNLIADDVATIAGSEVGGILDAFEQWQDDPAWPEFKRALHSAEEYLHAATSLCFASALLEHHQATELVPSGGSAQQLRGSTPSADIRMVVTARHSVFVEVKTVPQLGFRRESLTGQPARATITNALRAAITQFQGQPAMLVIGGFGVDSTTFDEMGNAAGEVVMRPDHPNLMAIVISDLSPVAGKTVDMAHKTRIRSNARYSGPVRLVGEWAGEWQLREADKLP